jgi:hypothetical protein
MADIVPIRSTAGEFVRKKRLVARRVLKEAHGCEEVVVIGMRDGELWLRGAPNDPGHAMWMMELAKRRLTRGFE